MSRILLVAAVLVGAVPASASLYQPAENIQLPARPDGTGTAFEFDQFQSRFVTLGNIASLTPNRDRTRVLERAQAWPQIKKPAPDDIAAHGADLLRLGELDKAVDLLVPRTRDRNPNYFLLMTLVHVHLARGDTAQALSLYQDVFMLFELKMPAAVKGWTPEQRDWIAKLDETWLGRYLEIRKEAPAPPDQEEPTPLFPLPVKGKPWSPVRFVNEAGEYEPGRLAQAERDKLPPDAIAIVQQLLLWFPSDTRLYWLLGELYAADGRIDEADTVFYQCTWGRYYGNRRVLMEHKGAVLAALEARRQTEKQAEEDRLREAYPVDLRMIFIYFAAVVGIAAFAILRRWRTKRTRHG